MSSYAGLRNGSTPVVLLVHGAFTDTSSWQGVIAQLQLIGVEAVALANPLRGLDPDAAYIASIADEIDGPVILVGHSYGGAVITVAGASTQNVLGLVYVAGYALEEGESMLDLTNQYDDTMLTPCLRPAVARVDNDPAAIELYIDRDAFSSVFAADLPARVSAVAARSQRPITASAFEAKASAAAWKMLRSWYIVATADRVIAPDAQRFMAARAGAIRSEIDASHAIPISQSSAVANQIRVATLNARAEVR
ncbi:MAG: alpha/beta fold hydrolase [Solirubrobacteraceae bacterium]